MEIESLYRSISANPRHFEKQRKSPENGDWKNSLLIESSNSLMWNKESLLKMEIERWARRTSTCPFSWETKKVSWKWRLKVISLYLFFAPTVKETKKVSWKWRLKGHVHFLNPSIPCFETKKVSWKWRLKAIFVPGYFPKLPSKQRKSPENGDWK